MWILASFVISSVFYVVLYGTGAGLIKSPFCLNLDPVLLFVSLSVVLLAFVRGYSAFISSVCFVLLFVFIC